MCVNWCLREVCVHIPLPLLVGVWMCVCERSLYVICSSSAYALQYLCYIRWRLEEGAKISTPQTFFLIYAFVESSPRFLFNQIGKHFWCVDMTQYTIYSLVGFFWVQNVSAWVYCSILWYMYKIRTIIVLIEYLSFPTSCVTNCMRIFQLCGRPKVQRYSYASYVSNLRIFLLVPQQALIRHT